MTNPWGTPTVTRNPSMFCFTIDPWLLLKTGYNRVSCLESVRVEMRIWLFTVLKAVERSRGMNT